MRYAWCGGCTRWHAQRSASLADVVVLERGPYEAGTTGQRITVATGGIAAPMLAVRLTGRVLHPEP
ncbi:hypothetical protein KBY86_02910 [Synechococcus sp. Lug-A]|uniref:hypothetical protein n=1 Tax=Synechococcus sp. Lug-A TaxID=2823740 RepID=UPI0020CF79FE|nr:hypothetical protein [Synechococcus sp. Lug-A]MCP9845847.1 hypothetical protein [Synechococcus sp. Lug-A]